MIMIVAPNPGDRLAALSTWLGVHVPNTTCRMLGLGGWGVTKNHMLEAKLSQVVATKSGFSNRTLAFPYMALENAP